MADRNSADGFWMRKTEAVEFTGRKNKKGRKNNKSRGKKFAPLDVNITFDRSSTPEENVCKYDDSLVLVSVPRDGFCIFHTVLRAQESYRWGDSSLTLEKLLKLVELEAIRNKTMYICYFNESDQKNFELLLRDYLQNGSFDTVLGDLMPSILANALNVKITIEQDSSAPFTVEPCSSKSSHGNEIRVKLHRRHYEPYIKLYQ